MTILYLINSIYHFTMHNQFKHLVAVFAYILMLFCFSSCVSNSERSSVRIDHGEAVNQSQTSQQQHVTSARIVEHVVNKTVDQDGGVSISETVRTINADESGHMSIDTTSAAHARSFLTQNIIAQQRLAVNTQDVLSAILAMFGGSGIIAGILAWLRKRAVDKAMEQVVAGVEAVKDRLSPDQKRCLLDELDRRMDVQAKAIVRNARSRRQK